MRKFSGLIGGLTALAMSFAPNAGLAQKFPEKLGIPEKFQDYRIRDKNPTQGKESIMLGQTLCTLTYNLDSNIKVREFYHCPSQQKEGPLNIPPGTEDLFGKEPFDYSQSSPSFWRFFDGEGGFDDRALLAEYTDDEINGNESWLVHPNPLPDRFRNYRERGDKKITSLELGGRLYHVHAYNLNNDRNADVIEFFWPWTLDPSDPKCRSSETVDSCRTLHPNEPYIFGFDLDDNEIIGPGEFFLNPKLKGWDGTQAEIPSRLF